MTPTLWSSFLFLTNVAHFLITGYYEYAELFMTLFVSSILYRLYDNIFTIILDKLAILAVILYGGSMFWNKMYSSEKRYVMPFIVLTFVGTIYLYSYGYCYNEFCFDEDPDVNQSSHAFLHFIYSMGHHLIGLI
jgi:cation transport ATPase